MSPTDDEMCAEVARLLDVDADRSRPDAVLTTLVQDSFRLVEMAIEVQDDYDVIFGQDDLRAITTVADLAELVRSRRRSDPQA